MKIIKNILSLFLITILVSFSSTAYGSTTGVSQSTLQKAALVRMQSLGVIDRLSDSTLNISKKVRRDVFAKMLIISSGLQDTAATLKYQSIFPDVKTNNNMVGYVNAAVNKSLLAGLADRKFHPEQNVTFAQVCTAAVRVLGYTDSDLKGVWPQNYIEKARALKLLDGIGLKNNDGVTRAIAATIIDRLLNTNIKKPTPQDGDKTLLSAGGVFTDCIILGNTNTSNRLDNNQILTDQGILYTINSKTNLVVGNKYRLLLDGDKIKKVYYTLKTLKNIVIDSVDNTKVTYTEKKAAINMTLPDKVTYYYDGVKQSYSALSALLPNVSSIIFAYNDDKVGFEYGVIVSSALIGYADYIVLGDSTTSTRLDSNQVLTDKGILYLADSSIKLEVGHKYKMLIESNDNITKVYKDLRTVKTIKIDSIANSANSTLGNVITYTENGKSVNMTLPDKVSYYKDGAKQTYEAALTTLQGDTSIIFGNNENNVGYEYAVILTNSEGTYANYTILGNKKTIDRLEDNQVLTDKGVFYTSVGNIDLEIGKKYRLLVNNDTIKNVQTVTNSYKNIVVRSISGTNVTYIDKNATVNMTLPDKVAYYYQGVKQTYDNLKTILQGDSTIMFINNSDNSGYESAIVIDPIYSKPVIARGIKIGDKSIGSIDLVANNPVVRNGEFINAYSIEDGDVVYEVSDYGNTSKYILALDTKLSGKITGILPNRIYPTSIQIDNKSYDLSNDMDLSKLNSKTSPYKIGDIIDIYPGHDGKIVNLDYPLGYDNTNYALVLNTSSGTSNGTPVYSVKLLKVDGTIQTYNINFDGTNLKGLFVTYTSSDDINATLVGTTSINAPETIINVSDMKIGNNYVTENVRIFDLVSNNPGMDAVAKVLNWSDLYSGTLIAGKVKFLNQVGAFSDVNVILLNDVFDEGMSFGLIKNIKATTVTQGKNITTTNTYTIGVNGKDYQFTSAGIYGAELFGVLNVALYNNQINYYSEIIKLETEATKIQAIDGRTIKLNDSTYRFRNDVVIYYRDAFGVFTTKLPTDLDITKTYTKVDVYLDKPLSYGGKVKLMFITE